MKIKDRAKPKTPPVEPGVYMAVCIGFIDLGEQYSEMFKSYSNKGMYIWELPGETIEVDGNNVKTNMFELKIRAFVDACYTNGPAPVPTSQILYNQAIIDGIIRSNACGHEVTIDL